MTRSEKSVNSLEWYLENEVLSAAERQSIEDTIIVRDEILGKEMTTRSETTIESLQWYLDNELLSTTERQLIEGAVDALRNITFTEYVRKDDDADMV